ncbi:MAG: tyrosine-type recombinase/integrase [Terracidiphilus sp.]|nr:tyrosine-type recombinase/integrase [Terracidiphilus sp.]
MLFRIKYEGAGKNGNEVEVQRRRLEHQTTVRAEAVRAGIEVVETKERKTLAGSAREYIVDTESQGAAEAALQASLVTRQFIASVKKTYVDEVTRKDILQFLKRLERKGNSDRTRANKFARLKSWLLFAGASKDIFPPKPKYEKKLPTTYTEDQISSILGAADPYMTLVIKLAHRCGLREQEIVYLTWADVDFKAKTIRAWTVLRSTPLWSSFVA